MGTTSLDLGYMSQGIGKRKLTTNLNKSHRCYCESALCLRVRWSRRVRAERQYRIPPYLSLSSPFFSFLTDWGTFYEKESREPQVPDFCLNANPPDKSSASIASTYSSHCTCTTPAIRLCR
ncbi:hypothetical protein C0J52_16216 [Blattella germanica]|nr:hypothetical protein C0J52_16216 [Blattella germanica]